MRNNGKLIKHKPHIYVWQFKKQNKKSDTQPKTHKYSRTLRGNRWVNHTYCITCSSNHNRQCVGWCYTIVKPEKKGAGYRAESQNTLIWRLFPMAGLRQRFTSAAFCGDKRCTLAVIALSNKVLLAEMERNCTSTYRETKE